MSTYYERDYARDLIPSLDFSWTEIHNEVIEGEAQADRLMWCLLDLSRHDFRVVKEGLMWHFVELWKEFPRHMQYAVWEYAKRTGEESYVSVNNRPFPSYLELCGLPLG